MEFNFSPSSRVLLGGSRSLVSSPAVAPVVESLLAAGCSLSVGCSAGADALALGAVLACGAAARLSVFAAGSAAGAGFWSGSAFAAVSEAAALGARVSWCAGGALSLPLRARLLRRSLAALSGCALAVFFQPGPGSLAVAAAAAARGLPVVAFAPSAPAALASCAGAWSPCSFCGLSAWCWSSAQVSLF